MNFWLATAPGRERNLGLSDSSPETEEYKEAESILKEEQVSTAPSPPKNPSSKN